MTDYHGLAPLPVASRGAEGDIDEISPAFSDPGLVVLADFLQTVITAEVDTAFATDFPTEGTVIRKAYPHDPREDLLEAEWLPALFVWRGAVTPKHFEDGNYGSESTILCFWVFPPAAEEVTATIAPILNGVAAALAKAINFWNGRHPSWVVDGDTDPYADSYGSSLLDQGDFWVVGFDGDFRFSEVSFAVESTGRITTQAIFWQMSTREHYVPATDPNLGTSIQLELYEYDDAFTQDMIIEAE